MTSAARLQVSDLLARPGASRQETVTLPVDVRLTDASAAGDVAVDVTLTSMTDGVLLRGSATVSAEVVCCRCLRAWREDVAVSFEQTYRERPLSEDEMEIEPGGWIDVGDPVHDEVSLGLPRGPVCRPDCRGLCPTCGTDLNTDPCDGHGDDHTSPFAALKDLFEP